MVDDFHFYRHSVVFEVLGPDLSSPHFLPLLMKPANKKSRGDLEKFRD